MRRLLYSPFLITALLIGGFSAFLAYRGQNDAAMTGAGAAVAAAITAGSSKNESDDPEDELNQVAWLRLNLERLATEKENWQQTMDLERENTRLRCLVELTRDNEELRLEITRLNERLEQQAKIKELELEIERLKSGAHVLREHQRAGLLPESESEAFEMGEPETQIIETSKNCE